MAYRLEGLKPLRHNIVTREYQQNGCLNERKRETEINNVVFYIMKKKYTFLHKLDTCESAQQRSTRHQKF